MVTDHSRWRRSAVGLLACAVAVIPALAGAAACVSTASFADRQAANALIDACKDEVAALEKQADDDQRQCYRRFFVNHCIERVNEAMIEERRRLDGYRFIAAAWLRNEAAADLAAADQARYQGAERERQAADVEPDGERQRTLYGIANASTEAKRQASAQRQRGKTPVETGNPWPVEAR